MISAFTDTLSGFDSRRGNNIFWLGAFACVKAAPYFPQKILHKHCFQFLLDRRNEKQRLCIILGGKWGALWDLGECCPFGVLHLTLTAWRLGYKWKYTPMNANSLIRLSFSHKVKCYDVKNEIKGNSKYFIVQETGRILLYLKRIPWRSPSSCSCVSHVCSLNLSLWRGWLRPISYI